MKKKLLWTMVLLSCLSNLKCNQIEKPDHPKGQSRSIDFESIIETAKEKVFPALVCVKVVFEEYERGERKQREALGSGVIISPDGYAVTNNHVVEKATRIKCILYDRRMLSAKLIGRDKDTDLALIKIEPAKPEEVFSWAEFNNSSLSLTGKLKAGDFVMALGAPWGFERSVSLGIVGNAERFIDDYSEYSLWIQTDASINPGNSGGPLINTDGKIVGINTLGSFFGGDMAFSVPGHTAQRVVEHLKKDGEIKRAWTGLQIQPLRDLRKETFLNRDTGVLVSSVDKDSPALKAGIQIGDLILKVNHLETNGVYDTNLPEIRWFLGDLPVNQPAEFEVERNGKISLVKITPREKGKVEGEEFDCKRWDLTVKEINEFADPDLYYYHKKGVYIRGVQYPGNAEKAGFRGHDIILEIDNRPLTGLEDIKKLYEEITKDEKREKKLMAKILRGGTPRLLILKYDVDYDKE
ncbi:MAG: trypsin-like peptidase domain-containing protein [Planctomycetota bacterium]